MNEIELEVADAHERLAASEAALTAARARIEQLGGALRVQRARWTCVVVSEGYGDHAMESIELADAALAQPPRCLCVMDQDGIDTANCPTHRRAVAPKAKSEPAPPPTGGPTPLGLIEGALDNLRNVERLDGLPYTSLDFLGYAQAGLRLAAAMLGSDNFATTAPESEPAPPTDGPTTLGEVVDEACAVLASHGWVCGGATMVEAVDNACSSGLVAARRAQRLQDESDALRERVRALEDLVREFLHAEKTGSHWRQCVTVERANELLATTQEPPAKEPTP